MLNLSQFEPSFIGQVMYGTDYITSRVFQPTVQNQADRLNAVDPDGSIDRFDFSATIAPEDGSTPFQMEGKGIQKGNQESNAIATGNAPPGPSIPYGALYSGTRASVPVTLFTNQH